MPEAYSDCPSRRRRILPCDPAPLRQRPALAAGTADRSAQGPGRAEDETAARVLWEQALTLRGDEGGETRAGQTPPGSVTMAQRGSETRRSP
jgi:hypothetical protein